MRKARILIAVALLAALAGQAQTGKITGRVEDPARKPLEAITATLVRAKDTGVVKIELTDKSGLYQFNGINKGSYRVMLTGSGYPKTFTGTVELTENNQSHDLGAMAISPESKNMKEITVVARKPFIEQKIDKMVVNVDAAVTNAGTTVLEVLEKSPGITVDGDGKISLKGKQQVMVMIDGKPTYLGQAELTNLLKTMPSSSIEQIEIMTNPSAKYDAAGNSGIINLKTKKNKQYGFNGSVNANYTQGKYWRTNDNLNLNYRNGKLNVFANGGYSKWNSFQDLDIKRTFKDPNDPKEIEAIFEQTSRMRSLEDNFNMKLGADYYLSKKTTIGFVSTGLINPENFSSNNKSYLMDAKGVTDSIVMATSNTTNKWKNGTLNFNFRHQFDSTGRELTADLDYATYSSAGNQIFQTETLTPDMGTVLDEEKLRGYLPVNIDIYAAKVDYVQNLWKGKLETGLKSSFVTTENAANYYEVKDQGESVDYGKTNMFDYKENIYAAYINYNRQFKKFGVQAGLRYEYTQMEGDQYGNPTRPDSSFSRDYGSLFPTVFISYNASKNHMWGFNVGRRIDRPAYQDLNPFLFFIDPYTYQSGNPFLRPQFSNNVELSHTFKGFLTTTLNYSHTKDFHTETFEQAKLPNGEDGYATIVRKGNIGKRDNAGIAVSAQVPVKKWWTAIVYTNWSYSKFAGTVNNEVVDVEAATLLLNINNQFKFNKGWSSELSGFWRSKGAEGQILIEPLGQVSAGVAKQVMKGKGTLKMNIRDMFYTQIVKGSINFQNTAAEFRNARDSRNVTLSFTYRFGKPIKGAPQRKTGGAKDEQSRVKMGEN
jgi:outer membrane receptor protein involved in Fe transport